MLFDLGGKRRRVVQATYLLLAVLMGGGLVLFGIGGDVSGGLFDAFSERRNSSGDGSELVEGRIERANTRLAANPKDEAALKELVRARYQLASQNADPNTGAFGREARAQLRQAGRAWERYLALDPDPPDPGLASLMVQAYGEGGLNQPERAVRAAEIVAEARPSAQAFLLLTRYASLAGQTRTADLAGDRAIELAPRDQRRLVRQQVEQAKAPAAGAQGAGAQGQAP
jgi:hypothetical protein